MKKSLLILILLLTSCRRNTPVHVSETPEQKLFRTEGVTCADLTKFEPGTTAPLCARVVQYHDKAVDTLISNGIFTAEQLSGIRMVNVAYLKRKPMNADTVTIWPPMGSILPVFDYTYVSGVHWAVPVTGRTILGDCCRNDGLVQYAIHYGSEESIFHEELHRISWQLGAEWWPEIAHLTERDPLKDKLDVDAWINEEYKRNHQLIGDFQIWKRTTWMHITPSIFFLALSLFHALD